MADGAFKVNKSSISSEAGSATTEVVYSSVVRTDSPILFTESTPSDALAEEFAVYTRQNNGILVRKLTVSNSGTNIISAVSSSLSVNMSAFTAPVAWTTRTTWVTKHISAAHYANGLFVIGDGFGSIRTSTDGVTWTTRTSNFGNWTQINGITYGAGVWVAVGYYGQIRSSTDAITWTTRTSHLGTNWSDGIWSVAYANGVFLAGAYGSPWRLRSSTDGVTWTTRTLTFGSGYLSAVGGRSGQYLIGGGEGLIATSTDLVTWVTRGNIMGNHGTFNSIVWDVRWENNKWLAVGYSNGDPNPIRSSTDGITWTTVTASYNSNAGTYGGFTSIAYGSGVYLLGQYDFYDDNLQFSTDGTSFDYVSSDSPTYRSHVTYGNGLFFMGGGSNYGSFIAQTAPAVNAAQQVPATLDVGASKTWTASTWGVSGGALAVGYGNGLWVLGGLYGRLWTSTDKVTWTTRTSTLTTNQHVRGLAYGSGRWVMANDTNVLRTSTDGVTWATGATIGSGPFYALTYSSDRQRFLAAGQTGKIAVSTDGVTWSTPTSNFSSWFYSAVSSPSMWVVTGYGGAIRRSTDGVTWATSTSNVTFNLDSVDWGNGMFAATGNSSQHVVTSTDGTTWTSAAISIRPRRIKYGNGWWMIAGYSGNSTLPTPMLMSTDTVTWSSHEIPHPGSGYTGVDFISAFIYADNGWFLTSSQRNQIRQSTNEVNTTVKGSYPYSVAVSASTTVVRTRIL